MTNNNNNINEFSPQEVAYFQRLGVPIWRLLQLGADRKHIRVLTDEEVKHVDRFVDTLMKRLEADADIEMCEEEFALASDREVDELLTFECSNNTVLLFGEKI